MICCCVAGPWKLPLKVCMAKSRVASKDLIPLGQSQEGKQAPILVYYYITISPGFTRVLVMKVKRSIKHNFTSVWIGGRQH